MNSSLATRCASRAAAAPRLISSARLHQATATTTRLQYSAILSSQRRQQTRLFSSPPSLQNRSPVNSYPPPPPPPGGPHPRPQGGRGGTWKQWALFNLAGVTGVLIFAGVLKSVPGPNNNNNQNGTSQNNGKNAVMNKISFRPFIIAAKEQVSPTAFVLTLRAGDPGAPLLGRGGAGAGEGVVKEAWEHGLWSVEVKQPQLQIARHYTPLPLSYSASTPVDGGDGVVSLSSDDDDDDDGKVLRFLIRKVDGGEVSTYLSKQRVGDPVWLRGPHLGFDVEKRLGGNGNGNGNGDGDGGNVVFLAGGTGIAPALQIARKLLDARKQGGEEEEEEKAKPRISILWANRRSADALGREELERLEASSSISGGSAKSSGFMPSIWGSSKKSPDKDSVTVDNNEEEGKSSLAQLICDLHQKHPNHFRVSYFVDEEDVYIGPRAVRAALSDASPRQLLPAAPSCAWHAPAALEQLPDNKDAERRGLSCLCTSNNNTTDNDNDNGSNSNSNSNSNSVSAAVAGANLICVSGPDGFIDVYAGPKRWHAGTEMQGPVRGLLERVLKDGEARGNWLVLKL